LGQCQAPFLSLTRTREHTHTHTHPCAWGCDAAPPMPPLCMAVCRKHSSHAPPALLQASNVVPPLVHGSLLQAQLTCPLLLSCRHRCPLLCMAVSQYASTPCCKQAHPAVIKHNPSHASFSVAFLQAFRTVTCCIWCEEGVRLQLQGEWGVGCLG